jgi:putative hydrolase of the HAD superfamily
MSETQFPIPWANVDTVLVDMDGTLLDLAFDNYFWLEVVPEKYAEHQGLSTAAALNIVARKYAGVAGTLPWYSVDHWSGELGIDIRALKQEHSHLIRYLPMVPEFLAGVRSRSKSLIVVTNAHSAALAIKLERTRLDRCVDGIVCAHDFDAPKESQLFWAALARRQPFDPGRTLLIEDSVPVLTAARQFGIKHMIAIRQPDSRRVPRAIVGFDSVNGVADLV